MAGLIEGIKQKIRNSPNGAHWWAEQIEMSDLSAAHKEELLNWLFPPVDQNALVLDGDLDDAGDL